MDKDSSIFDNISFADIVKDIYNNSKNKKNKIDMLLDDLRILVKNVNDAVLVVPLIKEYLEIAVKNDEQLVKIAAVLQKLLDNKLNNNNNELLSDEEKNQLLMIINESNNITKQINDIENNKLVTTKNEQI